MAVGEIPVSDTTNCLISENGINWTAIPTELMSGYRLKFQVHMKSDKLYVASVEPYRLSDLEKLKTEISQNPLVEISTIGKTAEGRPLEIIRVGNPDAPYRVFIRARAHSMGIWRELGSAGFSPESSSKGWKLLS